MADPFEIKRDATLPAYRIQLFSTNPVTKALEPHDLSNITNALFYMRKTVLTPVKVDGGVMSVVGDPVDGWLEYPWDDNDTDESGTFLVEIKLIIGTKNMKFPSKGYFSVTIEDDLVDAD